MHIFALRFNGTALSHASALGTWIDENAERIHFKRYTGLAEMGDQ